MKKAIVYTAAGLGGFLLLTGFAASRWHGHGNPGRYLTAHIEEMLDDVKATDAQRSQIMAIEQKVLEDAKGLHQQMAGGHQELLAQWNAAQPDAAKVHALIDARIDALRKVMYEAADGAIQAHGILTPDQRAQISKKLERRAQLMHEGDSHP